MFFFIPARRTAVCLPLPRSLLCLTGVLTSSSEELTGFGERLLDLDRSEYNKVILEIKYYSKFFSHKIQRKYNHICKTNEHPSQNLFCFENYGISQKKITQSIYANWNTVSRFNSTVLKFHDFAKRTNHATRVNQRCFYMKIIRFEYL